MNVSTVRRGSGLLAVFLAVGLWVTPSAASAQSVDVQFAVTPEFSDWLLELSIRNDIAPGTRIWSFGVHIASGSDIPSFGVPVGWFDAGSGAFYNNNWSTDPSGIQAIEFGQMLTGFVARDNGSDDPPQSVEWIARTIDENGVDGIVSGVAFAMFDPLADLTALADGMVRDAGLGQSLTAQLHAGQAALDDGNDANDVVALRVLTAFIRATQAQAGKHLTQTQAEELVALAEAVIDALQD